MCRFRTFGNVVDQSLESQVDFSSRKMHIRDSQKFTVFPKMPLHACSLVNSHWRSIDMKLNSNSSCWTLLWALAAVSAFALCRPATAAAHATVAIASPQEDSAATTSRVLGPIDETRLVRLAGNTHPLARAEFDQGPADPQRMMDRIMLVLRRSPAQEAALDEFMAGQYDPKSANFHHWLEPEEFGRLYGPSDADIAAVTSWLENHGFQIVIVAKGRVDIEFSGTVGQVERAFHTEIHRYLVDGKEHIANVSDPSIPAALEPVVIGPAALHDFIPTHQSELGGHVIRDRKTGEITPLDAPQRALSPQLTYTGAGGNPHEDITPYDFATIYNLLPLWNAGIDGAGVKIAIAGVSDIEQSDLNTFRSSFGLPPMTLQTIHDGADPGIVPGGTIENTADVEWSGATAKNAQIVLVTASAPGLSMQYIIDNKVAPIMSGSYGACESELGTAGNSAFNGIYKQGAAEGISIFISAGDQGATGCDKSGQAGPVYAMQGLQVNGLASSPYVTGVGGTDFNWF
jgi:subtilase family serine protease